MNLCWPFVCLRYVSSSFGLSPKILFVMTYGSRDKSWRLGSSFFFIFILMDSVWSGLSWPLSFPHQIDAFGCLVRVWRICFTRAWPYTTTPPLFYITLLRLPAANVVVPIQKKIYPSNQCGLSWMPTNQIQSTEWWTHHCLPLLPVANKHLENCRPDGVGTVTHEEKDKFQEIKERLRVHLEYQITNFRYECESLARHLVRLISSFLGCFSRSCFPFGRPEGALKATLSLMERVSDPVTRDARSSTLQFKTFLLFEIVGPDEGHHDSRTRRGGPCRHQKVSGERCPYQL